MKHSTKVRTRLRRLALASALVALSVPPLCAEVTTGITPAARLYDGAAGFEATAHVDWQPGFLADSVPGLAFSALGGYTRFSANDVTTDAAVAAGGVGYYLPIGTLGIYVRPSVVAGIQHASFSGTDADAETAFLATPEAELGFRWPSGLSAGVYMAFRIVSYTSDAAEGTERSLAVGPRVSFTFGD